MLQAFETISRERYLLASLFVLWFLLPVTIGAVLSKLLSWGEGRARAQRLAMLKLHGPTVQWAGGQLPSAAVKVRKRRDRGTHVVPVGVASQG